MPVNEEKLIDHLSNIKATANATLAYVEKVERMLNKPVKEPKVDIQWEIQRQRVRERRCKNA